MKPLRTIAACCALLAVGQSFLPAQVPLKTHPWSLDELVEHTQEYPRDSFGSYALLQLAEQQSVAERNRVLRTLVKQHPSWSTGRDIRPNWLGFTSGALAVQESLQLDQSFEFAAVDSRRIEALMEYASYGSDQRREKATFFRTKKILPTELVLVQPWKLLPTDDGVLILDADSDRIFKVGQDEQVDGVFPGNRPEPGYSYYGEDDLLGPILLEVRPTGEWVLVDRRFGTFYEYDSSKKLKQLVAGPAWEVVDELPGGSTPLVDKTCQIVRTSQGQLLIGHAFRPESLDALQIHFGVSEIDRYGNLKTIAVFKTAATNDDIESFLSSFGPDGLDEAARETGEEVELPKSYPTVSELARINCLTIAANGDVYFAEGKHLKRLVADGKVVPISLRGSSTRTSRWYGPQPLDFGLGGDGGPVTEGLFKHPSDMVFDQEGNLFVVDTRDHCVRKISAAGVIETYAGNCLPGLSGDGGLATEASLNSPRGLAIDGAGDLLIADTGNGLVRKVDSSGQISTIAGVAEDEPARGLFREDFMELSTEPTVPIDGIRGPDIPSIPFEKLLDGERPDVSRLTRFIPGDFYYIHFESLPRAIDVAEYATSIGGYLENQSLSRGYTSARKDQLMQQLALNPSRLQTEDISSSVKEVAIVGSDLYWELGSDFSVLFRFDVESNFLTQMKDDLKRFRNLDTGAQYDEFALAGIQCQGLSSGQHNLHCFSAVLEPGVYVRSNSRTALERIIEATQADGKTSLFQSLDLRYLRKLMPLGADEEHGFIFLSDEFIRHQIGPRARIKQDRRLRCFANLYRLQHATLLHQTQTGTTAMDLQDLVTSGSLSADSIEKMKCPSGGTYQLGGDGCVYCSVHGRIRQMNPCLDTELGKVSESEINEYENFVQQYSDMWRTYFDPIAIRIQVTPDKYRLETVVLPLIENSIYMDLAETTQGAPMTFASVPLPNETVISGGIAFDKKKLFQKFGISDETSARQWANQLWSYVISIEDSKLPLYSFLSDGIGDEIQIHICDDTPILTFNGAQDATISSFAGMLVSSLISPMYAVIPVKDANIVNDFLEELGPVLSKTAVTMSDTQFVPMRQSYTEFRLGELPVHRYSVEVAGVGLSYYFAVVGDQIMIANQPELLQKLQLAAKQPKQAAGAVVGNVFLRMTPKNWNKLLLSQQLHSESAHCDACLNELGSLTKFSRAGYSDRTQAQTASMNMYGMLHRCPSGGDYRFDATTPADDRGNPKLSCSVHGDRSQPQQLVSPQDGSKLKELADEINEVTAAVQITPDGLRAVLEIKRTGNGF